MRSKDTDYPVEQLLTKRELKDFKRERQNDPKVIAVLEARQQDRERRQSRGESVAHRPDDVGPSQWRDAYGREPERPGGRRRMKK